MCFNTTSELLQCPHMDNVFWRRLAKKHNLRIRGLSRRRRSVEETKEKMKMKNWKLFMENRSIIQENEKLKKKAILLHQENQELLTLLHNKFPQNTINICGKNDK